MHVVFKSPNEFWLHDNEWHHYCIVCDEDSKKLFVDGDLIPLEEI